jgi:tetratricopeptide (TPR) repeat protein
MCFGLLILGACASVHGTEFPRAMRAADEAAERGDPREAARRFERAAELALLSRDRDKATHAAARAWARGGATDAALRELDDLASQAPPGLETAAALYEAALLRLDADHDADAPAWGSIESVVLRFPSDGAARPALHRWLDHLEATGGPPLALRWLERVRPALDSTDRAEEIAFETAHYAEAAHAANARSLYLAVAGRWPYPSGALWDLALWRASELALSQGKPADAVSDLERMLAERERASIVGSAERAHYADAQLKVGEIYRDLLRAPERALAAFHALYLDFPDSPLRERGLFEEARLRKEMGQRPQACADFATLLREFPESRYAPCALQQCPELPERPGKNAPATCHTYLSAAR